MRQSTLDLIDSELRDSYLSYQKMTYENREKIFTHSIRVDPWWSGEKHEKIKQYQLDWSPLYKYSVQPDLDEIISTEDIGIYLLLNRMK